MGPFEYIIVFLSFIYSLAMAHLLFAWTRMIRHRRQLVFSWPHLLWMLAALANLAGNWLSLWDFRGVRVLSLATIASGFVLVIINYSVCALVSPDLEAGETHDMRRFHECEGPTYIGAMLVLIVTSIIVNFFAGTELNVTNWSDENYLVIGMLVPPVLALFVKTEWAQVLAPVVLLIEVIAYAVIYYPVLA